MLRSSLLCEKSAPAMAHSYSQGDGILDFNTHRSHWSHELTSSKVTGNIRIQERHLATMDQMLKKTYQLTNEHSQL